MPFKPKHMKQFSEAELEALERLNLNGSPTVKTADSPRPQSPWTSALSKNPAETGGPQKVNIDLLEKKAEESSATINGHT